MLKTIVAVAVAAQLSFQPPMLAGVRVGENVFEAFESLEQQGIKPVELRTAEKFQSYALRNASNNYFGSVSVCNGRIFSIIVEVSDNQAFFRILRDRIFTYGQPKINFRVSSSIDGTQSFEQIVYNWGAGRYEMAAPTDGSTIRPNQSSSAIGKCL